MSKQVKPKIVYFDFENEWKIKTSTNNEFSFLGETDSNKFFENEIQQPHYDLLPNEALSYLGQEEFEEEFCASNLRIRDLP